ncbi:MAG: tRNA (adenosine(37)-N6)-dimethylallyltransferase MiaA [Candidatus Colwellbacteria bacterium]|nr:tRNA (adenosine(37)-N6)-dimethylallyltransferase MiaA [Candidatus Colwellbacteria bacterium]
MKKSVKKLTKERPKIIVILGPNASGKSALGVGLAKKFSGEIISADSRQVYRGLDIGTGKITKREMAEIRHHLLDVASPKRVFTVAQYQKLAQAVLEDILRRGKLPIIVGGTGLYIDALLYNTPFPAVPPNPKLRQKLEKESSESLFKKLERLDPDRAANIDPKNKRRLVRALEIVLATAKPVPALIRANKGINDFRVLKIGIALPEEKLKDGIARRLEQRIKTGMIREVKKLRERGLTWKRLEELGLEYRYTARHLQGLLSREEMIQKLEIEIWRYAKRQMIWFKRDKNIIWLSDLKKAFPIIQDFLGR